MHGFYTSNENEVYTQLVCLAAESRMFRGLGLQEPLVVQEHLGDQGGLEVQGGLGDLNRKKEEVR